jgi:hypothetical protein
MTKHPFRVTIESGASAEKLGELLAPEAVLFAPMLSKPVTGASRVLDVLSHAARIAGPIECTLEVNDPRQTFLTWKGRVGGFPLEAVTVIVDGDDGRIEEVRVLMRPWPVVTIFRNEMYDALSAKIPRDYWELTAKAAADGPRTFTPIALKPIESAPDMVLHSPMLAKSVSGKAKVTEAVAIAHEVQSASSYTSIIATPELVIELFDCDADGYPMEGMWIRKVNLAGQVDELTVYLRPYPAVTVLRNRTRELAAERSSFLSADEYWELPRGS